MKGMIFAAGLGTRLKPLTDTMPKALVPVDDVPLLKIVASRLKEAGIDPLIINTHHFADQIADYVRQEQGFGARVLLSPEPEQLLETGGGILHARPFLEGAPFLAHNVDILSNLDLRTFIAQARPDALSTLVVSERETNRYLLFGPDLRLVGWTDLRTGEVRSPFQNLDPKRCRKFAFAGIHLLSGRVFSVMDDFGFQGRFSIIDFYLKVAADHPVYGFVPDGFRMLDVGKPGSLEQAHVFANPTKSTYICNL
ncbi:MAG: nucleotidyltransferase family protein [Bacteroidales bacterium]|nr:nucleotidyltransferase family protein [Bacteroidales bacterium]